VGRSLIGAVSTRGAVATTVERTSKYVTVAVISVESDWATVFV
jgi:hypothetical protein